LVFLSDGILERKTHNRHNLGIFNIISCQQRMLKRLHSAETNANVQDLKLFERKKNATDGLVNSSFGLGNLKTKKKTIAYLF